MLCSGLVGWVFQEYKKANELRVLEKNYGLIWKYHWGEVDKLEKLEMRIRPGTL